MTDQPPLANGNSDLERQVTYEPISQILLKSFSLLISIITMLIMIYIAAGSVLEAGARLSVRSYLNSRIAEIDAQVNESIPVLPTSFAGSAAAAGSEVDWRVSFDELEQIDSLRRQGRRFQSQLGELTTLELVGSGTKELTLVSIQQRIAEIELSGPELEGLQSDVRSARFTGLLDLASLLGLELGIAFLPNDVLLALAVTFCGAIGAVVAGLRTQRYAGLVNIMLGLAAGFIAFLALKGGKFLFIVQVSSTQIPVNPYASAFAGILVGLFTERVYEVVSRLFDQAAERVVGGTRGARAADRAAAQQSASPSEAVAPSHAPSQANVEPISSSAKPGGA